ncbi:MAG: glycosyltransferase family 2 protein [Ignisphaera sp.]
MLRLCGQTLMLFTISLAMISLPLLIVSIYHTVLSKTSKSLVVGEPRSGDREQGFLSIITPIKNEPRDIVREYAKHFHQLRESIGNLFECIVVADYSDSRAFYGVLEDMVMWDSIFVVRRFNGFGGRNGAINDGIKFSIGGTVSAVDVDGYPSKEVIESMLKCKDVCISWWRVCDKGLTRSSRTIAFLTEYGSWLYYKNKFSKGLFVYPLGSGTAIKRDILVDIGLYRTDAIQDDIWLGTQLLEKGVMPRLIEPMCVGAPKTVEAYLIQQRRWAYGTTDVLKRFGKHILKSRAKPIVKLEALLYILQPIIAILPAIGFILAGISPLVEYSKISIADFALLALLLASLAMESINVYRFYKEFGGYDMPYVSGRASALTTVTSIAVIPYVIASLIGVRIPYRVTPKQEGGSKSITVIAIAMIFGILTILDAVKGCIPALVLSMMPLAASLYIIARLE